MTGEFELNGFACKVIERPDLHYLSFVCGTRIVDTVMEDKIFLPRLGFEPNVGLDEIKSVCSDIMAGNAIKVERCGNTTIYMKDETCVPS